MVEFILANSEIISQIAGTLATVLIVASYFARKRVFFFVLETSGCFMIALSYLVNQNFFGSIAYVLAAARMLSFAIFEMKHKEIPWWLVFVIEGVNIISCILLWGGIFDIIMLTALVVYTLFCKIRDGVKMRAAMLIPLILYPTYAICTQNWGSIAPGALEFVASFAGLVMELLIRRRAKNKEAAKTDNDGLKDDVVAQNEDNVSPKTVKNDSE